MAVRTGHDNINKHFPVNIKKTQVLYTKATSKKTYKYLTQEGLIYKKKTSGGTTWALTKEGVQRSIVCLSKFK